MTIRKIAQIGHPVLRKPAEEVSAEDLKGATIQTLIDDLIETMRDANGAGLAAPQIHEPVRVCAIEVSANPRYPYKPDIPLTILVNPVITPLDDEQFENYEGCLSVPDLRGVVKRYAHIHVKALDREGNPIDEELHGFTAGTYQHEVDHLDATLFVDKVHDPSTFTTWKGFDRYHKAAWLERAAQLVEKYGS